MSDQAKVRKGDWIRSNVSLEDVEDSRNSMFPGQALEVGKDISVDRANVLCLLPEDEPRASVIDADLGKRLRAEQQSVIDDSKVVANEVPPAEAEVREAQRRADLAEEERREALEQLASTGDDGAAAFDELAAAAEGAMSPDGDTRDASPNGDNDDDEEEDDVKDKQAEVERATSPAAEKRETATPPRRRKRVQPPEEKK